MKTPAQMLKGLELQGASKRWRVVKEMDKANRGSGGHFSTSYIVEDEDGNKAFLKAMDLVRAFQAEDPLRELEKLTATFNFERDLLAVCANHNLDRIVRILDEGKVEVEDAEEAPVKLVNFLVFELAEGDVSCQVDKVRRLDTAVCLRTMHHVAIGLQQLHGKGIAHQDVRPSNVLQFKEMIAKLADLGRAASTTHSAPHDKLLTPGCIRYAPPEFLYRMDRDNTVHQWRCGGDFFLLGSMLYFMFEGQMLMPEVHAKLAPEHTPDQWTGSYDDVLPYLRKAFGEVVEGFVEHLDEELRPKLVPALKELCEPDPRFRGHPHNVASSANQYSVERYISLFNLLAIRAALRLRH